MRDTFQPIKVVLKLKFIHFIEATNLFNIICYKQEAVQVAPIMYVTIKFSKHLCKVA